MTTSFASAPAVVPLPHSRVSARRAWLNLLQFLVGARLRLWTQDRVLGFWWWLLEPMAMTATYFFMVQIAFRGGGIPNYPLFVMCAMLPWVWFSTAGSLAIHALVRNGRLIKSFRVSYLVFPSAEVLATTVRFAASLVILIVPMIYYGIAPTRQLLWMPLVIAVQLVFTLGMAYWLAISQVYIEDTINVWQVVTRIWFFLSPSIYAVEIVPERLRPWYMLNPFAVFFSSYREIVIHGTTPMLGYLTITAALGAILMLTGVLMMRRLQGTLPLQL